MSGTMHCPFCQHLVLEHTRNGCTEGCHCVAASLNGEEWRIATDALFFAFHGYWPERQT
jgi:hypothetical protein